MNDKDYEVFLERMGSFDMSMDLENGPKDVEIEENQDDEEISKVVEDALQHHGVKGMRWGVVRWRTPGGKSGQTRERGPNRMRQEWDSARRERHWNRVLDNVRDLSTSEVNKLATRASLENELKRLSKSKVATKEDKQSYRTRENLSDQELNAKVGQLRAYDNLQKAASNATKQHRDIGRKIAVSGGSLLVNYALNDKITALDVYNAARNSSARQIEATVIQAVLKGRDPIISRN